MKTSHIKEPSIDLYSVHANDIESRIYELINRFRDETHRTPEWVNLPHGEYVHLLKMLSFQFRFHAGPKEWPLKEPIALWGVYIVDGGAIQAMQARDALYGITGSAVGPICTRPNAFQGAILWPILELLGLRKSGAECL